MAGHTRRWWLGVVAATLFGAGCDPATTLYFLTPESKEAPELKRLASEDEKKEVKVAILVYNRLEPQADLIQVDRQLNDLLARAISTLAEQDKEKLTVIPPRRVEEYKNNHPSRHGPSPEEVGEHFKTDYVIYLELNQISLYEPGAGHQLLRGRAHIFVAVYDIKHPDESREEKQFTCMYPNDSHGPFPADAEMPPQLFREMFLKSIAKRLSYYFVPHSKRERMVDLD
jgi:hypothetical protein